MVIADETIYKCYRKVLTHCMQDLLGKKDSLGGAADLTRNRVRCRNSFSVYLEEHIRN